MRSAGRERSAERDPSAGPGAVTGASGRRSALRVALAAAVVLALASTGCVWSREVVNAQIRSYDVSTAVVGQTTNEDILEQWGPPAPVSYLGFLNPLEARTFRSESGPYRYVSQETRCTSFLARAPLGLVLPIPASPVFPFIWCDIESSYVIALEFDREGVLQRIVRERSHAVWRPFRSPEKRKIRVDVASTPGSSIQ
jgi:hypothetical protein